MPAALGVILATSVGAGAAVAVGHWQAAELQGGPAAVTASVTAAIGNDADGEMASPTPAQAVLAAPAATTTPQRAAGATVTVRNPGASYVSSSSTDRPVLVFSGWQDAQGQPLGSAGSVSVPVQVRLVSAIGSAQSATIYPVFTNGRSDYALPLWPFTQAMDPHVDTFTMQWRRAADQDWQSIDTFTVDVRLPEATAGSTLSYADGTLTGTGWTFGRSTNIGGAFKVALDVTDADGHTDSVTVLAEFSGRQFTVSAAALAAAGVTVGDGYTISATPAGGAAPIVVHISGSGGGEPSAQPSAEPTAVPSVEPTVVPSPASSQAPTPLPSASPTAEPTAAPSTAPAVEPTAQASAEPTTSPVPTTPGTATVPTAAAVAPTPAATPRAAATGTAAEHPGGQGTGGPSSAGSATAVNPRSGFEVLNEGVDVDPLVVQVPSTTGAPGSAAAAVDAGTSVDAAAEPAATDANVRPSTAPASPVRSPNELVPGNAGSLSGTREGTTITLFFPSAKVEEGDWVAVFVYPGATTGGWVQVDADNSVSLDISTLDPGSYKIAVGDRDSQLLGWAQLEITEPANDEGGEPAGVTLLTGEDLADHSALGADGWKLAGAAGLLVIGAASFILLAVPTFGGAKTRVRSR
ncbi:MULTISPECIES: hypothetical protein [Actinomyces]|uniref:hypothetical protein n=1 Tax=Actinomyces TaxID=1654 RepID=UPI001F39A16D|nr:MULTISPECIES: hypothetical protein [Actinomyces]